MFPDLQNCRRCPWWVHANLGHCPNCGAGVPRREAYESLRQELETKISPAFARSSVGLPSFDEGGGCIFFALFAVTLISAFNSVERDEGCGGFLEFLFTCLVAAAVSAGIMQLLVHSLLIAIRKRRAESLEPRRQEIEARLRDSSQNLWAEERRVEQQGEKVDGHLKEVMRSLEELTSIASPNEVLAARKAFFGKAMERLAEKQACEMKRVRILGLRWWNSLAPLGTFWSLPQQRDSLNEALRMVQACQAKGGDLGALYTDRVWPENMTSFAPMLEQGLRFCNQVEQFVRRRMSNLDLSEEADRRYQFTELTRIQLDSPALLAEPDRKSHVPAIIRRAFELAGEGRAAEFKELWDESSVNTKAKWARDILALFEIRPYRQAGPASPGR